MSTDPLPGSGNPSGPPPADAQFRAVFDISPVAMATLDDSGRCVHVNAAFTRIVGKDAEEVIGHPLETLGDDPVSAARLLEAARTSPHVAPMVLASSGARRWLEWQVVSQAVGGMDLLVCRDVTERHHYEVLQDLQRQMAVDVAAAPDFPAAMARVIRHMCEAAEIPAGEAWSLTWGNRLTPAASYRAARVEAFSEPTERDSVEWNEGLPGRVANASGPVAISGLAEADVFARAAAARAVGLDWVLGIPIHRGEHVEGVLLFFAETAPEGAYAMRDLLVAATSVLGGAVERRRREDLQNIRSAIVDGAHVAIIGKTLDGTIVSWNNGARELYGYEASEVVGRNIALLAPPDRQSEIADILVRLEQGQRVDPFETERVRKDGSRVRIDLTVSPVRDALGRIYGASAMARDVTRMRQLEEELRRTQRMDSLGRLAGGVAHDFNNLLTVILGETEALSSSALSPDQTESLEQVRRAAERAASLTRQLLSFSRPAPATPEPLDLNHRIRDLSGLMTRVLRSDVRLELDLANHLGRVLMDPTHLEQVLLNLAGNAREAMADGGRLTIETHEVTLDDPFVLEHATIPAGDYVVLRVTDTGVGMPPEVVERVFEPFFTTRGDRGGTGLGLSTCYGIVRQAGGHIWVDSEPGRGTTFRIYLPNADGIRPTERPEVPAFGTLPGGETVLLVDDEPLVRAAALRGLRHHGYRVLTASGAEEALKLAEIHPGPIAILVTDLVMPRMGGKDLAREIKRRRPGTRVLIMSGLGASAMMDPLMAELDVAVLEKPFTPKALARRVREVLDAMG